MEEKNPQIILLGINQKTPQTDIVTLSELEVRLKISSPTLAKLLQKHKIKPIIDFNKCPRYLFSEVLEKLKKDR
jgi:hypothetical protein